MGTYIFGKEEDILGRQQDLLAKGRKLGDLFAKMEKLRHIEFGSGSIPVNVHQESREGENDYYYMLGIDL